MAFSVHWNQTETETAHTCGFVDLTDAVRVHGNWLVTRTKCLSSHCGRRWSWLMGLWIARLSGESLCNLLSLCPTPVIDLILLGGSGQTNTRRPSPLPHPHTYPQKHCIQPYWASGAHTACTSWGLLRSPASKWRYAFLNSLWLIVRRSL